MTLPTVPALLVVAALSVGCASKASMRVVPSIGVGTKQAPEAVLIVTDYWAKGSTVDNPHHGPVLLWVGTSFPAGTRERLADVLSALDEEHVIVDGSVVGGPEGSIVVLGATLPPPPLFPEPSTQPRLPDEPPL